MRTLLLLLFTVAWAAVALAVIRALMLVWGQSRRVALATAVAVAAAYVLGAASPWSLNQRGAGPEAAPVAAPVAAVQHPIGCPSGLKLAKAPGQGHIDTIRIRGTLGDIGKPIAVTHTDDIRLGGWVVAANGTATGMCVLVDGRPSAYEGLYGLDRPDVATALGKPEDRGTGFDVRFRLPPGSHVLTVGPVQADGSLTPLAQALNVQVH